MRTHPLILISPHACFVVSPFRHRGFTLLDVLFAMLIFAIGFLGLTALHTKSLTYYNSANARLKAAQAVYDLEQRMRSNPSGVAQGFYNQWTITSTPATTTSTNTCATFCTAQQIATLDLHEWTRQLQQHVAQQDNKQPIATVIRNASHFTVTIHWRERQAAQTLGHTELTWHIQP